MTSTRQHIALLYAAWQTMIVWTASPQAKAREQRLSNVRTLQNVNPTILRHLEPVIPMSFLISSPTTAISMASATAHAGKDAEAEYNGLWRASGTARHRHLHQEPCLCPALLPLAQTLAWLPGSPQAVPRQVPDARGWGCPHCLPAALPLAGAVGSYPATPVGTPPAASPSPQGATVPRSAQAATSSRGQEMGRPQVPI